MSIQIVDRATNQVVQEITVCETATVSYDDNEGLFEFDDAAGKFIVRFTDDDFEKMYANYVNEPYEPRPEGDQS